MAARARWPWLIYDQGAPPLQTRSLLITHCPFYVLFNYLSCNWLVAVQRIFTIGNKFVTGAGNGGYQRVENY